MDFKHSRFFNVLRGLNLLKSMRRCRDKKPSVDILKQGLSTALSYLEGNVIQGSVNPGNTKPDSQTTTTLCQVETLLLPTVTPPTSFT